LKQVKTLPLVLGLILLFVALSIFFWEPDSTAPIQVPSPVASEPGRSRESKSLPPVMLRSEKARAAALEELRRQDKVPGTFSGLGGTVEMLEVAPDSMRIWVPTAEGYQEYDPEVEFQPRARRILRPIGPVPQRTFRPGEEIFGLESLFGQKPEELETRKRLAAPGPTNSTGVPPRSDTPKQKGRPEEPPPPAF